MKRQEKDYQPMTIGSILDMLHRNGIHVERLITHGDFAINLDLSASIATPTILNQIMTPFHIKDYRLLRLLSGRLNIELNFAEHELAAGDIFLIRENSYFEIKEVSGDTRAEALVFVPDKYHTDLEYVGSACVVLHPETGQWDRISRLIYQIYEFSSMEPYPESVVEPLVAALVNYVVTISKDADSRLAISSSELIFNRFIEMLNNSYDGKYPVSYYAGKLCITPQYLSKVVTQVSGKTASDYINKAVIMKTKILLRDKRKTISEIADAMHFTSDSSFCRFFRHETGLTPTQYRNTVSVTPLRTGLF